MALKPVPFAQIPVIQGPRGPKGDKGDKGDFVEGPPGPQGPPGKDGKDGEDGKTVVKETIRVETDNTALAELETKLRNEFNELLKKITKLEKRKPENYFPGGLPSEHTRADSIVVTFDGGGSVLSTGDTRSYVPVPYNARIVGWYITGDPSGSVVVDVWKAAGAIPTNSNTIAGTEKPTLSSQSVNSDTTLTTWSPSLQHGDILGFEVESATTVTKVTLTLKVVKEN